MVEGGGGCVNQHVPRYLRKAHINCTKCIHGKCGPPKIVSLKTLQNVGRMGCTSVFQQILRF